MNPLKRVLETEPLTSSSPSPFTPSQSHSSKKAKTATPLTQSSQTSNLSQPSSACPSSKRLLYSASRVVKVVIPSDDVDQQLVDPALRLDEADLKSSRHPPASTIVKVRSSSSHAAAAAAAGPTAGERFVPSSSLNATEGRVKKIDAFDDSFTEYNFPFTQIENLGDVCDLGDQFEDIIKKSPERKKRKKRALNCKRRIFNQPLPLESPLDVSVSSTIPTDEPDKENVQDRKMSLPVAVMNNENAMPNESAQQRALRLFEEVREEVEKESRTSLPVKAVPATSNAWASFSTASNKPVGLVSEEARKRAEAMFDEVSRINASGLEGNQTSHKKNTFVTANHKSIEVSVESPGKVSNLSQKVNTSMDSGGPPNITLSSSNVILNVDSSCMFSTASNKPVQISDKAKQKALAFFEEINQSMKLEVDSIVERNNDGKAQPPSGPSFRTPTNLGVVFSTASNKAIHVSETAQRNALRLFEKVAQSSKFSDEKSTEQVRVEEAAGTVVSVAGSSRNLGTTSTFSTAINRPIQFSEHAQKRALAMFEEVDQAFTRGPETLNFSSMFSTASNKPVEISEAAQQKALRLLDEVSSVDVAGFSNETKKNSGMERASRTDEQSARVSNSSMLSMVSNKTVQLSEHAQKRALAMFEEVDQAFTRGPETLNFSSMFSTASNKPVEISEAAQQKALRLLDEVSSVDVAGFSNETKKNSGMERASRTDEQSARVSNSSMLSMVSNKTVQLSEHAQKLAEAMFEEVDQAFTRGPEAFNFSSMFSTASNKPVKISEAAQQKALRLLDEVASSDAAGFTKEIKNPAGTDETSRIDEPSESGPSSLMFSTASNKTIQPSETALKRALAMFDEVCLPIVPEVAKNVAATSGLNSTANNETVEMSDTARVKASRVFEEVNQSVDGSFGSERLPLSFPDVLSRHNTVNISDNAQETISKSFQTLDTDRPNASTGPFKTSPSMFYDRPNRTPLITGDEVVSVVDAMKCEDQLLTSAKRKVETAVEPLAKKLKQLDDRHREELNKRRDTLRKFQQDVIRSKKRDSVKACPGLLLRRKSEGPRLKLENALKISSEINCEMNDEIMQMTPSLAEDFKFRGLPYFSYDQLEADSVHLIDYFHLVLDDSDAAGIHEVSSSFLASPHVDPSLIPDGWIQNHYKWIVWKLACYDRRFSRCFSSLCLTPENLLLQLKYRYDREIDMAERSCLKKILEGDEPPSRKFVCCVSSIRRMQLDESDSSLEIELTDGWYSLWSVIDSEMSGLLKKGVVTIGTKLVVQGASLLNWEGGCSPLQVSPSVKLKISANSVRRVKWFVKMGFTKSFNAVRTTLKYALPNGGTVGVFTAEIVRVYPILHMSKDADGKTVFRNERCAQLIEARLQQRGTDKAEQLYEEVWREVEKNYKLPPDEVKGYSLDELKKSSQADVLYSALELDGESGNLQGVLDAEQLKMVTDYREQITFKIRDEVDKIIKERIRDILPNQKVTKLLKVRVVDSGHTQAILSIWNPPVEMTQVLLEGKIFDFYNFVANGRRDGVLQLSSSKHSFYNGNSTIKSFGAYSRSVTKLASFKHPGPSVHFGEVDIVGLVVSIQLPEIDKGVTKVFVSDLSNNIVSIAFWTSLKAFGCDDLLVEKAIMAAGNLQWRPGSGLWKMPCLFATEASTFSMNPKQGHFAIEMNYFKEEIKNKDIDEILDASRETVTRLCSRPRSSWSRIGDSPASRGSPRFATGNTTPRPSSFVTTPGVVNGKTPRPLPPPPPHGVGHAQTTPRTPVDQRVKLLSRLGSAPPLSPWPVRLCRSEFKSPMSDHS